MQSPDQLHAQLVNTTDDILKADVAGAYRSTNNLFELLNAASGNVFWKLSAEAIVLDQGCAVDPAQAANCIKDSERTRVFVRAVHEAIIEARRLFPREKIRVLYAGCGPFAPLAATMADRFPKGAVEFTLLDIHRQSVDTVQKIIRALKLEYLCPATLVANAIQYRVDADRKPHVIVCEAMDRGLLNEPQAAITANLAGQRRDGGFFLPEAVYVDASVREGADNFHMPVGNSDPVFKLTPDIAKTPLFIRKKLPLKKIPPAGAEPWEICLETAVRVFRNLVIGRWFSSITSCQKVANLYRRDAGATFRLGYIPGGNCIVFRKSKGGAVETGKVEITNER